MSNFVKRVFAFMVILAMLCYTMPIYALANEEIVYSKLKNNGERYKTIVSVETEREIKQKETEKELPISLDIEYQLNGEKISAEELAGKSGNVKIILNYKNNSAKKVNVNGHIETMYTPFVVISGAIINGKNNKNIKITNGKTIENGDNTVVVGIAIPGLNESLNLPKEMENLNKIEISMETTDFEIDNIITYCTSKIVDVDIPWQKLNRIFNEIGSLKKATNQLEDGANELKDGVSKLNSGTQELKAGADEYAKQVQGFVSMLNQSLGKINSLIEAYNKIDLNGLANALDGLQPAMAIIAEELTKMLTTASQINFPNNSKEVQNLEKQIAKNDAYIKEVESINETLDTQILEQTDDSLKTLLENQKASNITTINFLESNNDALNKAINSLNGNTESISQFIPSLTTLQDSLTVLGETMQRLDVSVLKAKLNDLTMQFSGMLASLNFKPEDLASLNKLADGAKAISDGVAGLANGTEELNAGVENLSSGIHQFNAKGIRKISKYINVDLKNLVARGKILEQLSKDYESFESEEKRDKISFVLMLDSIKISAKEETKEQMIENSTSNIEPVIKKNKEDKNL